MKIGAHKYNPVAIAAKNGELPAKPQKKTKRELERELHEMLMQALFEKSPETAAIVSTLSTTCPY